MSERVRNLMRKLKENVCDSPESEEWESYGEYLASDVWKSKRDDAITMAGGTCQLCGERPESIDVHHNTYSTRWGEEGQECLTVLCRGCHSMFHEMRSRCELPTKQCTPVNAEEKVQPQMRRAFRDLIGLLLARPELQERAFELYIDVSESSKERSVLTILLDQADEGGPIEAPAFISTLSDPKHIELASMCLAEERRACRENNARQSYDAYKSMLENGDGQ